MREMRENGTPPPSVQPSPGFVPKDARAPPQTTIAPTQPPKQQPAKPTDKAAPVAVPNGEAWWNYICRGCQGTIRDPDDIAVVCPHPGCNVKDPNPTKFGPTTATTTATTTAFTSTFSKNVIETERRNGEAGPGSLMAPSLQDQKTPEEIQECQDIISTLKDLQAKSGSSTEFTDSIKTRELELQKLKSKLPVQEAQQARGTACAMSAAADIETKRVREKERFDSLIQKTLDKQVETVANAAKRKKYLDDQVAIQKASSTTACGR